MAKVATMTDAEFRIIAFLEASNATRPADLPNWLPPSLGRPAGR